MNEPFFQGHYPSQPIMPGVLIIEAMAQASAILVVKTLGADSEGKIVYFMTIEDARFRSLVTPGDTLRIAVTKKHRRSNVWKFEGICRVEEKIVAEAKFSAMVADD